MDKDRFYIKSDYTARSEAAYFDDSGYATSDIVHQPDAYILAQYLAVRYGADSLIDIGCGSARKLMELNGVRKIGVDFGSNLDFCRKMYPKETWIEANLDECRDLAIESSIVEKSVVVCADVIEHLVDPSSLILLLSGLAKNARALIITTPERDLVRGVYDRGPPANSAHVREWNLREFEALLTSFGLAPAFIGLTVNNNRNLEKKTILAVIDCRAAFRSMPPITFRPLAIVASYNDGDIIEQIVSRFLDDNIDVHLIDNWSTDGSFERLSEVATFRPELHIERFPSRPTRYYEWASILSEKARIAAEHADRWIIHADSDEIRSSPWSQVSLREGLWVADQAGFNAIDFTVLDFRPDKKGFEGVGDIEKVLQNFEFGKRPGHFIQVKAWKQPSEVVDLVTSGGHEAQFRERKIYPYKFLLKHYSLRSEAQAKRKIFSERKQRFSPAEIERGWHVQYDYFKETDQFSWDQARLNRFGSASYSEFLTEFISGIGVVR